VSTQYRNGPSPSEIHRTRCGSIDRGGKSKNSMAGCFKKAQPEPAAARGWEETPTRSQLWGNKLF